MWHVVFLSIVLLLYLIFIKPLNHWKNQNVQHVQPLPLFGNMLEVILKKKSVVELMQELYNAFPDARYIGIFNFRQTELLIKDPVLIQNIAIKDFNYFTDRTSRISEDADPIFAKNLTVLTGKQWKDMRSKLSPSFTMSKIKFMFDLLNDCAQKFVSNLEDISTEPHEMKEVFSRFTNDAIASVAFGVNIDSMTNKENTFFLMGKNLNNVKGLRIFKVLGYYIFPSLMKLFKISFLPKMCTQFFTKIINDNIEERQSKGIVRPDMIQVLLQSSRTKPIKEEVSKIEAGFAVFNESISHAQNQTFSNIDITAQAMIFFFAGFETTSTLMSFMGHELAVNPDVQFKLQQEIDQVLRDTNGKITYEALLKMTYLDMVVSESLRKWPPGLSLKRICVKDYIVPAEKQNESNLLIKKGESINIPVYAIQHDEKYFPNPNKFDPDRFDKNNKNNIQPFTYIPFGIGPRSCIASRFALIEIKILYFQLLSKFELVPVEKTPIPLVITRKKFLFAPDEGFWLGIKKRTK